MRGAALVRRGGPQRFLAHVAREESAGRSCPTDWSWIVPPVAEA
ncbi:MAG: nitric oxide synthase oxygenase [Pseudonocardia sp.]|nr:nitric oxide synthase oxygenase [Pseudonocardia sp.]